MKPQTKQTTYTQSNDAALPTLDPTNQDVAKPFEPSNKTGSEAASYLKPESGDAAPMSADAVRNSAAGGADSDNPIAVSPDPAQTAARSADIKAAEAATSGNAFDNAEGMPIATKPSVSKEFLTTDPKAIYRNAKQYATYSDGKVKPRYDEIGDRIDQAFNTPGASRSLTGSTKDKIVKAVEVYGGKGLGVNLDDTSVLLDPDQYKDAKSITDMISRVTEDGEILGMMDLGGQVALIHGLSEKLIEWKVPELIDKLIDMMKEKDDRDEMYEEMCIRAAQMGDMDTVDHYAGKIEGKRRHAIWERVVPPLLSRFYVRRDDTRSHATLGSKLLTVLGKFNGNWDKDPKDSGTTCLYYYTIVSIEAELALRHTNRRIHAAAGRPIRAEHPWTTITRNFSDLN